MKAVATALLAVLCAASMPGLLEAQEKKHVPGQLLVMLEPDEVSLPAGARKVDAPGLQVRRQVLRDVFARRQLRWLKRVVSSEILLQQVGGQPSQALRKGQPIAPDALIDMSNLYLLQFPDTADLTRLIPELEKLEGVVYAEPNAYISSLNVKSPAEPREEPGLWSRLTMALHPNDPDYALNRNWGFFNSSGAGSDINAQDAWQIQTGNAAIRIAVIDAGMQDQHPDLIGKIVAQHDFVDDDGDSDPDLSEESPYHGMSVGGIAAGRTNNGSLSAGLCGGFGTTPGCSILDAKIFGSRGLGADPVVTAIEAIEWARANAAAVLNMSICHWSPVSSAHNAIRNAYISGALISASMGNSDGDCGQDTPTHVNQPAAYSDLVMGVGATNRSAERVTYGMTSGFWESAIGSHISVVAPGFGHWAPRLGASTAGFSGTSAAAPFVAGTAGLLFSESMAKGLQLTSSDIRRIIQMTAANLETSGWDQNTGYGLVDAGKALQVLQAPNQLAFGAIAPVTACTSLTPLTNWTFLASRSVVQARRCELRRTITFPQAYQSVPMVWGRPHTSGGVTPSNPNSEIGFTDVIPGSITTTGVTLRTYTYERWSLSGAYLGWYPTPPNQTTFAYAVLGPPVPFTVTANAPGYITQKATYPLTGSATHPATGWRWDRSYNGGSYSLWASAQNSQFIAYAGSYTLDWRLFARQTSGGATDYGYRQTMVCIPSSPDCGPLLVLSPGESDASASALMASHTAGVASVVNTAALNPPGQVQGIVAGHFGAGPWISRDGSREAAAVQLYSLAGRHDGASPNARPNTFALPNGIAARKSATLDSASVTLTELRKSLSSSVSTIALTANQLKAGSYRISYAIDPDLGALPGDDRLTWSDSLSAVVVTDPDSAAIAYGWAGAVNGAGVTLREYASTDERHEPGAPDEAYREQRAGSRSLGEPGDVRFALTLGPVTPNPTGRILLSFIAAQGKSPEEALANLLEGRRRTPSAAELALDADSSGAPRAFGLRQSLGRGGGPSFLAGATEGSTALSGRAQLRQFGITALEYAVAEGQSADVQIRIYSRTGQLVRNLLREQKAAGEYFVEWDALNERGERVAPGVYVAVMEAGAFKATRKLVITR